MLISSKFWGLLFGTLLVFCSFQAQKSAVNISPPSPENGDTITVTYNSSSDQAKLKNPKSLILTFSENDFYELPDELEMKKNDKVWTISWQVPSYATFGSFYFKAGKKVDKGPGSHHYETFIYKNGTPKEGAYISKAKSIEKRYSDDATIDSMKIDSYQKELQHHPENLLGKVRLLKTKMNSDRYADSNYKQQAEEKIAEYIEKYPDSEDAINDAMSAYKTIGKDAKADSLQQRFIADHPNSQMAIDELYYSVRGMKHTEDKLKKLRKVIEHSNSSLQISQTYRRIFDYYQEEDSLEAMIEYAQKALEATGPWPTRLALSLAEGFAQQGDSLAMSLEYADLALSKLPSAHFGPIMISDEHGVIALPDDGEHGSSRKENLKSSIIATKGFAYTKQQNYDKAEKTLQEASEIYKSRMSQDYLANLYMETDRPKKAYDIYWDILMDAPTSEEYQKKLKQSYIAYNGSEEGFEAKTQKLDEAWEKAMKKKFKRRQLDKKTPSFDSIIDLQRNKVNSQSLEDKVVVIDMWATWCGPCISAFPHLEDVYESYKDNPKVKFMVINTGWRNSFEDAKKWHQNNDYSFPMYFDNNSQFTNALDISSIPATFIIGRDGNIKFKKKGFEGAKMEKKLKLQIEMLLQDNSAEQQTVRKK